MCIKKELKDLCKEICDLIQVRTQHLSILKVLSFTLTLFSPVIAMKFVIFVNIISELCHNNWQLVQMPFFFVGYEANYIFSFKDQQANKMNIIISECLIHLQTNINHYVKSFG